MLKIILFWTFVVMVISAIVSSITLGITKWRDQNDTLDIVLSCVGFVTALLSSVCFCVFMIGIVKLGLGV